MPMYIPNPAVAGFNAGLQQTTDYSRMLQDAMITKARANAERQNALLGDALFYQRALAGYLPSNYNDTATGDAGAGARRREILNSLLAATNPGHTLHTPLPDLTKKEGEIGYTAPPATLPKKVERPAAGFADDTE